MAEVSWAAELEALADEWEAESKAAQARADGLEHTDENIRVHTAERRQARVAAHHAAALRGVLSRHATSV